MKVYNLAADETDMQTNTQMDGFLHIAMVITGEDDGVGIYFGLAWGVSEKLWKATWEQRSEA